MAGLAVRGCRPPSHMHIAYLFLCVKGCSFVPLGVAKCLAVRLGQVVGVVVAAREYFRFLFSCFQSVGGGLGGLCTARGLVSPGPHLGAKAGLSCASRCSESWVFFLVPQWLASCLCPCFLVAFVPAFPHTFAQCISVECNFVRSHVLRVSRQLRLTHCLLPSSLSGGVCLSPSVVLLSPFSQLGSR